MAALLPGKAHPVARRERPALSVEVEREELRILDEGLQPLLKLRGAAVEHAPELLAARGRQ